MSAAFFCVLKTIYCLLVMILLCFPCILEVLFQPSLESFGISVCSALKCAEKVVDAVCATSVSPAVGTGTWVSLVALAVSVHLF